MTFLQRYNDVINRCLLCGQSQRQAARTCKNKMKLTPQETFTSAFISFYFTCANSFIVALVVDCYCYACGVHGRKRQCISLAASVRFGHAVRRAIHSFVLKSVY